MSRKSKKIALKTIRQYCQNELTRKAMAYASEATAIMQASTTTNAGSSRAHWFFVSTRRTGFDQEEAAARTAGRWRAHVYAASSSDTCEEPSTAHARSVSEQPATFPACVAAGGRDSPAGRRDAEVEHLPERVLKVHVVVVDRAPHVLLHPAVVCRGHANAK